MNTTEQDPTPPAVSAAARDWRERLRLPLLILGPVVVIAAAAYFYVTAGGTQSTDDAYVMAARVPISANVAGRVSEIAVHDNQSVHRGELLYRLDDASFRIAVHEAEAQLAAAVLQVQSLKANYMQRQSELVSARQTLDFRMSELNRQRRLLGSGIASQAQVDRAANASDEARSKVAGAQQEIAAVVAQLGGNPNIPPAQHPVVEQAQATLERARLNLSYTEVRAPAEGIVTRVEQLQVGSYVAATAPVFALVSTDDLWIEANFKENQLARMAVGQAATVRIDSVPGRKFKARVASLSPGTGSQFSMLPAENATGNWVKVVQRVPVRIEFAEADRTLTLHAGLSAVVDVDTREPGHRETGAKQATVPSVAHSQ